LPSERLFDEAFLRRLERLALIFRQSANSKMQGERRSNQRGQSVEFSDFRPYALGDDFRRIDWNAYARLERLFIKLFVAEEDATLHILIDNSRSMDWGKPNKLSYALQTAGALGYIALVGLDRVTAITGANGLDYANSFLPAIRGKQNAIKLFSFLLSITASPGRIEPHGWLSAYAARPANPGVVILISDLLSDGWESALSLLRSRGHDITLIHLLSPDEAQPDMTGDFRLIDSESQAEIEVTADFETLERYQANLHAWQLGWRQFCRARGMTYQPVQTSTPLEEMLFARLPKQGLLK